MQSERFLKRYLEYARTAVAPAVSRRAGETLAAEYVSLREEVRAGTERMHGKCTWGCCRALVLLFGKAVAGSAAEQHLPSCHMHVQTQVQRNISL